MAISASLLTMITAVGQAIVALFSFFLAVHNTKHDKKTQTEEKIANKEKQLDNACDNGTIDDLIDATKELGKSKK